jgi:hypothetical protein
MPQSIMPALFENFTPAPQLDPSNPVGRFIDATNECDLACLLDTFAGEALVNDQLRDYRGRAAIAEWAARDIIRQRLTMHVVNVVERYQTIVVTAHVDGDFDKRGLPEPLVVAFYFCTQGQEIVQLIILRNYSGT